MTIEQSASVTGRPARQLTLLADHGPTFHNRIVEGWLATLEVENAEMQI